MATNFRPDAESVSMFADELPGLRAFDGADNQQEESAARKLDLEVRSYRLLDIPAIGRFPIRFELYHPESDVYRPGAMHLATRRLFTGEDSNKPLYVALDRQSGERVGAVQCEQSGSDERWKLQYLELTHDPAESNVVPISMLEYVISRAGSCGARRIMARSCAESAITGALRATGFSAFTSESVYILPTIPVGEINRSVRIQEKSDVWEIHQLYLQTTPRDVQNAEALTSHEWDLDLEGRSRRGWLISSDTDPVAFVRVKTSRKYHRLDVMYRPGDLNALVALLHTVFSELLTESPRPTYVVVRSYQQELSTALLHMGLVLDVEQLLMVRYTTAPLPTRATEAFELLRPVETEARRVPSFYVRDVHE